MKKIREDSIKWKGVFDNINMKKNIYIILSMALLLYQIVLVVYANLTQIRYHLGYDASSAYLHAVEIWKQKSLMPSTYELTTTLGWDSPDPLAALFYGITGDIFISFGIANLILVVLLCLAFYHILKELKLKPLSICLAFNFFLCPLTLVDNINANNLSYFAMLLCEQGSYSVKILAMLMLLLVVIKLENQKKCKFSIVVATLLCLLTSVSSGLYVAITILVPCLLYYIIKAMHDNKFNKTTVTGLGFVFIQLIVSYAGKTFSGRYLGYASKESSLVLTGVVDFWKNFQAMILAYVRNVGGITLYTEVPIFSKHGILQLVSLCIMFITLIFAVISIIQIVRKFKKKESVLSSLFHIVNIVNIGVFTFSYTMYPNSDFEFECRYFIIVYIMIIIMFCQTVQSLPEHQLYRSFTIIAIIGLLTIQTVGMFKAYYNGKTDYDTVTELLDEVDELDVPVAYVWGSSFLVYGRNFRPLDLDVVYKILDNEDDPNSVSHFGDYNYYDETSEWIGSTALITTADEFELLPSYLQNMYTYKTTVGTFELYEASCNPFDLTLYDKECDVNINYMYTTGMTMQYGSFDEEGNYYVNGNEQDDLESAEVMNMTIQGGIQAGTYTVTLNYELESATDANETIIKVTDQDGMVIAEKNLQDTESQVILNDVEVSEDMSQFTVSCYNGEGNQLTLKSVQFELQ